MLVLSRREGESIVIDGDVRVTVLEVRKRRIKLAIEAPDHLRIVRREVICEIDPEADSSSDAAGEPDSAQNKPVIGSP